MRSPFWISCFIFAALPSLAFSSSAYQYGQMLRAQQESGAEESSSAPAAGENSNAEDIEYLKTLAQQTWNYLENHRAPGTGFPTDTQNPGGKTNTTNIGLYLASLGPAVEFGFISKDSAAAQAKQILESLAKLPSKRGFLPNWISVEGETSLPKGVNSVSDFNKLAAGLITVRQYFPELSNLVSPLLDRIDWTWLYEKNSKNAHYGYDLVQGSTAGDGSWWLAADIRLAAFFLIASDAAEPEYWDRLTRPQIKANDLTFFGPGYEWGGLFMQAMDAIFLDEKNTEMGASIADFAWHQIQRAKTFGWPAWGWSNCNIPGRGYTEGGFIPESIVTPHASVLVIDYYPKHVVQNLKALESLGLRTPLKPGDPDYGFRDSIDLTTKKLDNRYLSLDQSMLFLSLSNHLLGSTVRKHFAADPFVKKGLTSLQGHIKQDPTVEGKTKKRDSETTSPPVLAAPSKELTLDFSESARPKGFTFDTDGSGFADAKWMPEGFWMEFDLGENGGGEADVILKFPPIDVSLLDQVSITLSGKRTDNRPAAFFGGIRLFLKDDQDQGQYAFIQSVREKSATLTIAPARRYGIFAKPEALTSLRFKFVNNPWFHSFQKTQAVKGEVLISKISFTFKTDSSKNAAPPRPAPPQPSA